MLLNAKDHQIQKADHYYYVGDHITAHIRLGYEVFRDQHNLVISLIVYEKSISAVYGQ